ncbi:NADPH-dependent assimilatory sulfite reductase hemoprotein subunit [Methylophaga sp. OBS4]|uniref:NADPH-dependent assimilatory sulfite reductase hemoprotein subunit n=1 Tax=Methylophaga sp. OBS4 TaxID=2991935 RepID=UPI002250B125|nr:NADPH-dependent assimilatory sulfite reductase hemoprotein subunit [Methylophaga sp. OBS4]MCX4186877.1 NADPH-dependent assimilatory sulfite reductase hemoprotein subunit [Methylophaga sp. OBS4]
MNHQSIERNHDISQPVSELHENEQLKHKSHYLRGNISHGLEDRVSGSLSHDDTLLTKFHGIYQQDNRDTRQARQARKLEPHYQFMVRLRIPGGVLNTMQWNEIDRLSRFYASSGIRITTRQTIQLHGISKWHLRPLLKRLRKIGIDTIAACGDDSRGVVCGADPNISEVQKQVYELAKATSDRLTPKTSAYSEIWYEEKKTTPLQEEPIYGAMYLPRKFKVGYVIPPINDVDIFAQDVGFIAIVENNRLLGFNLCVGGGMGKLDSRSDSYPRLATEIGFINYKDAPFLAEVIMAIQRDYGDRKDRHQARFKYTIDRLGLDCFKALLVKRFGKELAPARPYMFSHNGDRLGWHKSADNKWYATLYIESGRVNFHLRDQLHALFQQFSGSIRLTTNQNLQLTHIEDYEVKDVAHRLSDIGLEARLAPLSQHAHTLSCVALPTCGLAMAEAERYAPLFLQTFEQLKAQYGLQDIPVNLRITGCPNGCARPYLAEVALTGRAPGLYNLYLGGSHRGDRLATLYQSNLGEAEIIDALAPLFELFAAEKFRDEYFGDFLFRKQLIKVSSSNTRPSHIFQEL